LFRIVVINPVNKKEITFFGLLKDYRAITGSYVFEIPEGNTFRLFADEMISGDFVVLSPSDLCYFFAGEDPLNFFPD